MASGHNRRERDLLNAIHEKNVIGRRIRKSSGAIRRWSDGMRRKRGKRWRAQYAQSVRRHTALLEEYIPDLVERSRDLKERIEHELDISVDEVKQYEQQFKKEAAELREAQAALEDVRMALAEAEDAEAGGVAQSAEVMAGLHRRHVRAARTARAEASDVKAVERELASEASDKVMLERELRRVVAELEALG